MTTPNDPRTAPEELRIDLAAMQRHGETVRSVDLELAVAWLSAVLGDTDAEVPAPAKLNLTVTLQPRGDVLTQGRMTLRLSVPCARCLDPAAVDGDADLFASYMPAGPAAQRAALEAGDDDEDEDGLSLQEEDLDAWSYEGTVLDLGPLVTEHVKLAYPMRALCDRGEACRGLCSHCGAGLNAADAGAVVCPQCGSAVPATPAGEPAHGNGQAASGPEKVGSLADALKKAGLTPRD